MGYTIVSFQSLSAATSAIPCIATTFLPKIAHCSFSQLAPLSEFAKGVMVNTWMSGATEKARDGPSGGSASGSGMDAAVQTNVRASRVAPNLTNGMLYDHSSGDDHRE